MGKVSTIDLPGGKKTLAVLTHSCIIIEFQTQETKPLGHQNCKCMATGFISFLAWFRGKTGEIGTAAPYVEKLEKIMCTYVLWP